MHARYNRGVCGTMLDPDFQSLQGLSCTSQHNIDWAQAIEWKFYFLHRLPLNIIKKLLLLQVLSLTNISLSLNKYLHYPNPAILTFVIFAVSAPILISKQPIPSPPPLSTLNLTSCNSLYYNLPQSRLNRLQQIRNCLARAVCKAPKFTHTTPILKSHTGSKSISVLSIKFFLLHIKFLLLLNLATSEI